ncbi:putative bifunctional diguanylate cyclase/phosphodiesterase [Caldovatus aquaticus]|uniref:Bifunctional diguanylate cyclase/phosphodiesterase n=1 Tax=Caldovatus aquaticus TaxID=2865671 RepID=A0ABS7F0I4_9PROT|nr:bifunctional diguanylate cyclase/phosphodiesterase [Caldovatus aquaticus]MBW8268477.1 bifunctional diguanylate cyclase/phosphodiesterase [Caldovatus aquaticus]
MRSPLLQLPRRHHGDGPSGGQKPATARFPNDRCDGVCRAALVLLALLVGLLGGLPYWMGTARAPAEAAGVADPRADAVLPPSSRPGRHQGIAAAAPEPPRSWPGDLAGTPATATPVLGLLVALLSALLLFLAARLGARPAERALARLSDETQTDALTGLPNRGAFVARLAAMLAGAGTGHQVALIVLHLDRLREANAMQGQAAGDALVREAAERMRRCLRPGDALGRLSGDEFAVAAAGLPDAGSAAALAARLQAALQAKPVAHDGRSLRLSATLGLAVAPDAIPAAEPDTPDPGARRAEALLGAACSALYRAKGSARGTVAVFSVADRQRAEREAVLLQSLEAVAGASPAMGSGAAFPDGTPALEGLYAAFQPQVRLADGAVTGFEALLRWDHPVLGPLSPAEFLPWAERAGHAALLGEAVRRIAFRAYARLRAAGLFTGAVAPPRLAVNLSAAELASPDCTLRLEHALIEAGLSPEALEIEITEEVLLDRVAPEVRERLAALRRRGARLALDDFGTGYAGLHQLLRLPLDAIKLDRCFVGGLGLDRRAEEIVRAAVTLAHSLGLELVAEGVETELQLARLRALRCDAVQGFLIARPMRPQELATWLLARRSGFDATVRLPTPGALPPSPPAAARAAPGVVALRRRETGAQQR